MNSKLPPQNIEAEQSLLGSLLIDKDAIVKVAGFLMPGHFYREAHSEIYRSIFALYERREPADLVTVSGELKDRKKLKEIGGDSYLADLVNSVPTAAHVESYANLVKDSHTRRELISTAAEISEKAYGGVKSMGELLDETEQKIFTISQQHLTRHFVPIKETLAESFDRLEELHRKKSHIRGIPTGFRDIDNKLSGLRDGSLIVLAARPSLGKTSLALNIAQYVTVHEKLPVGFFSLESSKEELVDRLLASQSNVDSWKITTGNLNEEDFTKIGEGMGILAEAPLFIDDTPGASIMEMRTKARRLQLEQGLRLLIVDYLQLAVSRNLENRVQEVSEISQGLKNLARELKCPVLAISQLSRAVEARGEKRPQLSDLRESGCLTGDTYIYLPDQGIYRRIDELVGREGFNVPSLNLETWQLEPCQVERAFATGYQAVSRLTTRLGRNLKATGNHKFLTVDGWRRLDELMVGTRIALPRRLDGPSLRTMSDEELALLGHLIGDGCVLPTHAIQYTTNEKRLGELVADLARAVFGEAVKVRIVSERRWYQVYLAAGFHLTHDKHNPVAAWFTKLGVFGLRSYEKQVPSAVFAQPESGIATFLKHLWATDGCINFGKTDHQPTVYYATSSSQLASDVQSLLLRLGINAILRRVPQNRKGRDQYHVVVDGKPDLELFLTKVGTVGETKTKHQLAILDLLKVRSANTNRDVIPREVWRELVVPQMEFAGLTTRQMQRNLGTAYCGTSLYKSNLSRERALRVAQVVESGELEKLAQSDIYWDEILSIEPAGKAAVYDLTVEGWHNFVANNIIVHNSIEQDSDVVMFLYRPVDVEEREQIKLLISKHRNGPTGEVDLIFKAERTRFYGMEKKR